MQTNTEDDNIFEFHTDEIPTCPQCGARTEPTKHNAPDTEEHKCPSCDYEFTVEYVEEENE